MIAGAFPFSEFFLVYHRGNPADSNLFGSGVVNLGGDFGNMFGRVNGDDLENGAILRFHVHRAQKLHSLFQVNRAETRKLGTEYLRENRNAQHSVYNWFLELRGSSIFGVEMNRVVIAGQIGKCLHLLLGEFEKMVECRIDNWFYLHKWVIYWEWNFKITPKTQEAAWR